MSIKRKGSETMFYLYVRCKGKKADYVITETNLNAARKAAYKESRNPNVDRVIVYDRPYDALKNALEVVKHTRGWAWIPPNERKTYWHRTSSPEKTFVLHSDGSIE